MLHFGGVFAFLVVRGRIPIWDGHVGVHGARSARFFSDFDVLAAENPKNSPFTLGWRDKRLRVWARGSSLIF